MSAGWSVRRLMIPSTKPPSEQVKVGFIGTGGMGLGHIKLFARSGMARICAVCDVDEAQLTKAAALAEECQQVQPHRYRDFRRLLENPEVEAVVVSTPDHWHAVNTIMACEAGKDVYVEKPLAHTLYEGRAMLQAVQHHQRIVQVGSQQRSAPHYQSAVQYIKSGQLGRVTLARAWISGVRAPMRPVEDTPAPVGVDYDAWLGPAPLKPFNRNRFHYNWRWFWDYGTGELGNWGAHHLDVIRWATGRDLPHTITSQGGVAVYQDAAETPGTQLVTYEFPELTVVWEHRNWSRESFDKDQLSGVIFYGTEGTMYLTRKGWRVVPQDPKARESTQRRSGDMRELHVRNFLECVKTRRPPAADIETGHLSSALCHLGNIAHRVDARLTWEPDRERVVDNAQANSYLAPNYRAPWQLPEYADAQAT